MKAQTVAAVQNDAQLVAAVLDGDRSAFAPLVEQYQAAIYNFTFRYTHNQEDAADLTQETFLKAFRFLHQYNHRLPFRNWLYAIAANVCRDWARSRNSRPATVALVTDTDDEVQIPADEIAHNPAELLASAEGTKALETAIAGLPDEYRSCFILFHIEGVPQADIATVLQVPVTVVKNRLYRARLRLRQQLQGVN